MVVSQGVLFALGVLTTAFGGLAILMFSLKKKSGLVVSVISVVVILLAAGYLSKQVSELTGTVSSITGGTLILDAESVPVAVSAVEGIVPGDEVTIRNVGDGWFITSFVHREEVTEPQ